MRKMFFTFVMLLAYATCLGVAQSAGAPSTPTSTVNPPISKVPYPTLPQPTSTTDGGRCTSGPSCKGNFDVYDVTQSNGRNIYSCGLRRDFVQAATCPEGWGQPVWVDLNRYTCQFQSFITECLDENGNPVDGIDSERFRSCFAKHNRTPPENDCPSPLYRRTFGLSTWDGSNSYDCENTDPIPVDERSSISVCNQCNTRTDFNLTDQTSTPQSRGRPLRIVCALNPNY